MTRKSMKGAGWFYGSGFHGEPAKAEVAQPTVRKVGDTLVVEQWDAEARRFVERRLVWDGTSYVDRLPEVA